MRYAASMTTTDQLHPRINGDTCIRCGRKFLPGDRITPAMIVVATGAHPNNPRELGCHLSHEFELAHIDCFDRALVRPLLNVPA
jgi:hypothetical protein